MLRVEGLYKAFGGLRVLEGIDFQVAEDEIVGLIGPNGAGKTTLYNVITGYYKPDAGHVLLDDEDITGLSPAQVCRLGLCRTFQIVKPFGNLSVEKNVAIGSLVRTRSVKEAHRAAMEEILFLGLEHLKDVPSRSLTLSDRKRLELARALATKPRFLLLDEVMCGLNPTEVKGMLDLIRRIHDRGIGIVVIEHIMTAVMSLSDRVVVLSQGKVIKDGTPQEVSCDPEVIKAYLGEGYQHAGT